MEKIIATFLRFAEQEAQGKSPIYAYWCLSRLLQMSPF